MILDPRNKKGEKQSAKKPIRKQLSIAGTVMYTLSHPEVDTAKLTPDQFGNNTSLSVYPVSPPGEKQKQLWPPRMSTFLKCFFVL